MMVRTVLVVALLGASSVLTAPAHANWLSDFFHSVVRDTKRRNCWPKPFTRPDLEAVRTPMATMVSNGWRRQNMLGDHHFVPEDGLLTDSGRLKLRWILTEAPQQHRTVFVHSAESPEATVARLELVRQAAVEMVGETNLPPVLKTGISSRGWPASRVEAITRKFEQSIPEPVLPKAEGGGSSN